MIPHCKFDDLLNNSEGIIIFTGSINVYLVHIFNKGLFNEIEELLIKLKEKFEENIYIEIQRHNDIK